MENNKTETLKKIKKMNCNDCPFYLKCPKMNGINICYGQKLAKYK